ncbi:MAG TPA: magnesium transporter CorA family protein [Vicinamibacterales bacterium]|nr:magnesium transporter CorA family protein [Vicinamibacterales bacterium]
MITIFAYREGRCDQVTSLDRLWLNPAAGVVLWVDLAAPSIPESLILSDTFAFHPLAVEDAMSPGQPTKVEAYDGYLFAVLRAPEGEIDFFVGPTFLVTVHHRDAKAVAEFIDNAKHSPRPIAEGPVALFHRIADALVDAYRPAVERIGDRASDLEKQTFDKPSPSVVRDVLALRRELFDLGLHASAQRAVVERLSRREFVDISTDMSFRFRDVHDHLVRVTDDVDALRDRLDGLLTASVGLAGARRWI